ncbi:MAG: FmdB family zinc ribbon protein [Candidatus Omnitrophota bacterium]|jgi:putative FmdB family regulatory protein|nr:zinc ribbon domain-containing protein [Candidatus Omnitrophota bacterium]MDD5518024.1 zinc ribbon domain-containing protein [Candidatus Omnitrophota bacterium]
MPTYEYECRNCNKVFDIFQKITDKPIEKCPKCHKKISRLIGGGSGIIFKGSGFYATDYRKSSPKNTSAKGKSGACPAKNSECSSCPHAR